MFAERSIHILTKGTWNRIDEILVGSLEQILMNNTGVGLKQ